VDWGKLDKDADDADRMRFLLSLVVIMMMMMMMVTTTAAAGGRPHELDDIVSVFFENLGLPVPRKEYQERRTESLIRENLLEPEARHLMLLTKNNAALGMLFGGLGPWTGCVR
jgi:hypothetical protein